MSAYLVQSFYHRQLEADEMLLTIKSGGALLLLDATGLQRYVERPARFPEQNWLHACAEGRVYLAWAVRWHAETELPDMATVLPVVRSSEAVNQPTPST